MAKNKAHGNMYSFLNDYPHKNSNRGYTWNVIKGICEHSCSYCFMKEFPQKERRFDSRELETDLGHGNFIFVGSSNDMFSESISDEEIRKVIDCCWKYPENKYLFQSKNPERFRYFSFPKNTILGTTLETDNQKLTSQYSKAPLLFERVKSMESFKLKKMVTVEPIMDFDLLYFVLMIKAVNPEWVNIGADSKRHNLPEPPKEKIEALIKELEKFTVVKLKDNLRRLMK